MTQLSQPSQLAHQRRSILPWVLLLILLIPIVSCGILGVITVGGAAQAVNLVRDVLDGGELVVRDPNPAVIVQVRELGRLETASYTVEKVIEGSVEQETDLLDFFLGDRLLLIAHGEVIAGVDLAELQEGDVSVSEDRQRVTLRLPPTRILTHRLDNEQSYVYDRQLGLLTKGDPDLETEVRQEAERRIVEAACEGGILEQAAAIARQQVRVLLLSMQFSQVEFLSPGVVSDTGCES